MKPSILRCGHNFLPTMILAYFILLPAFEAAGEGLDIEGSDLICIGLVADVKVAISRYGPAQQMSTTTLQIRRILKGDPSAEGKVLLIPEKGLWSRFIRPQNKLHIVAIRFEGDRCTLSGPVYAITSQTLNLPKDMPLREVINCYLIATMQQVVASPELDPVFAYSAFRGLMESALLDSRYYDLLKEYRRFEGFPDPVWETEALHARLLLKDKTALPKTLALAKVQGPRAAKMLQDLELFGDDAVTTLCLMLEGKYIPRCQRLAAEALRRMRNPASLPYLVSGLDSSDVQIQFYCCAAIHEITTKGGSMTLNDFYGPMNDPKQLRSDYSATSQSQLRVRQMKEWWEREGKKQFDYVLPKEK